MTRFNRGSLTPEQLRAYVLSCGNADDVCSRGEDVIVADCYADAETEATRRGWVLYEGNYFCPRCFKLGKVGISQLPKLI